MDFICDRHQLLEDINIAEKAVSKTTAQITQCLLITVTEDGYYLTGNNFEMAVKTSLTKADVKKNGGAVLEAQMFYEIIKRLPEREVHIYQTDENFARITSGKTDYKIFTVSDAEFPDIDEVDRAARCSVKAHILRNMIRQTLFAVSSDESKPVFTGELFRVEDGLFKVVAIDGFRVAYRQTADNDTSSHISAVVPSKTLNEIIKIMPQDDGQTIDIYFAQSNVAFCTKAFTVTSRLIEGEFFKYENLFGGGHKTALRLNRADFLSSIDRASLIPGRDGKKNAVKLSINDGLVVVSSKTELGTAQDELCAETQGDPIDIAFNPRYIADALKVIDEAEIDVTLTTPFSPCTIRPVGNQDAVYLVVPLRIQ